MVKEEEKKATTEVRPSKLPERTTEQRERIEEYFCLLAEAFEKAMEDSNLVRKVPAGSYGHEGSKPPATKKNAVQNREQQTAAKARNKLNRLLNALSLSIDNI